MVSALLSLQSGKGDGHVYNNNRNRYEITSGQKNLLQGLDQIGKRANVP